jgi:hypothetical protein
MATIRSLADDIRNVLDYLLDAELAVSTTTPLISDSRVTWPRLADQGALFDHGRHPGCTQYLEWLQGREYSAILFDGSLLQVSYEFYDGRVASHRLMYMPCPYDLEMSLLTEGHPIHEVVGLSSGDEPAMRSPIRFDFDAGRARHGHPAVHLTLNTVDCRIACAAPMHVHRFVDFVFRAFYQDLRTAHLDFFEVAAWRHLERGQRFNVPVGELHLNWDVNARETDYRTQQL